MGLDSKESRPIPFLETLTKNERVSGVRLPYNGWVMSRSFELRRLAVLVLFACAGLASAQDGWYRYRVWIKSPEEAQRLADSSLQLFSENVTLGATDVIVAPGMFTELWSLNLPSTLISRLPDADAWRDQAPLASFNYQTQYGRLTDIYAQYESWRAANPRYMKRQQIGTSHQGRPIYAYFIWNPLSNIRPGTGTQTPRPKTILINGVQHAREWIAGSTPMHMTNEILTNIRRNTPVGRLMNKFQLVVIPIVNPDGYEYSWTNDRYWRKNRRNNGNGTWGVDPNRNWAKGWGGEGSSGQTSSDVYRGPSAFSEPETASIRDFTRTLNRTNQIVGQIDFHSFGQYILWPWGDTTNRPPTDSTLNAIATAMRSAMVSGGGRSYTIGQTSRTLYLAAGNMPDWFYQEYGNVPCYTIELRDTGQFGFELPASQILPTIQENWNGFAQFIRELNSRY